MIGSAALFFAYRAQVASSRTEKNLLHLNKKMEQEVKELKARLAALQNQTRENRIIKHYGNNKTASVRKSRDKKNVNESEALRRLEIIVESTGLEQLATSENMDPTILTEMYEAYAERKQIDDRHEQQMEINEAYHQEDKYRYGDELMALYKEARLRGRGGTDRKKSDSAFAELVEKYPEAFATGMAIAERALYSSRRKNTSAVEKYYDMLRENDKFSYIVTDRGVEAVPNIEYYLAREYLRQGDTNSAVNLIESLEEGYPDSLLYVRGARRDRRWQPVGKVVSRLRRKANLPD